MKTEMNRAGTYATVYPFDDDAVWIIIRLNDTGTFPLIETHGKIAINPQSIEKFIAGLREAERIGREMINHPPSS